MEILINQTETNLLYEVKVDGIVLGNDTKANIASYISVHASNIANLGQQLEEEQKQLLLKNEILSAIVEFEKSE